MTTTAPAKANGRKPAPPDPWAPQQLDPDAPQPSPDRVREDSRPVRPTVPAYTFTTRTPTGTCPYPLILVEGPEYTGKSRMGIELANDPRIGRTLVVPMDEDVDWLGAIASFEIVVHDGSWWQLLAATQHLHAQTTEWVEDGEATPLVMVDGDSAIWHLLSTWAENRARTSDDAKRRLMLDPNAEINVGHQYWNAANRRHRQLVQLWRSMPAIVVVTARGKQVSAFDKATGRPIPGTKEYSVQAQGDFPFATTAWVRLSPGQYPQIVGARMATGGVRPGLDEPVVIDPRLPRFRPLVEKGWEGFDLSWLVFDVLKFDPRTARPSQAIAPAPDAVPDAAPQAPKREVADGADEYPGADAGDELHPAAGS